MPYTVEIAPAAERDLKRLPPPTKSRIYEAISALGENARPVGSRKVAGRERSYRIRVRDFRIIYEVFDDAQLVVVARILRRSETTYRRLP